jgi:hypothetical protein
MAITYQTENNYKWLNIDIFLLKLSLLLVSNSLLQDQLPKVRQKQYETYCQAIDACRNGDTDMLKATLSSPLLFNNIEALRNSARKSASAAFLLSIDGLYFRNLCYTAVENNQAGPLALLFREFRISLIDDERLVALAVMSEYTNVFEVMWMADARILHWQWYNASGNISPPSAMRNNAIHTMHLIQSLSHRTNKHQHGTEPCPCTEQATKDAVAAGSISVFKILEQLGDTTPLAEYLVRASRAGNLTLVQYLIEERGMNVDTLGAVQNETDGMILQTALIAAAGSNRLAVIDYLFSRNADPRRLDSLNRSAIYLASIRQTSQDILAYLERYEEIYILRLYHNYI